MVGPDYYYTYMIAGQRFLSGASLYGDGFYNAPWLGWLLAPFGLLPPQTGYLLWSLLSIALVLYAVRLLARPALPTLLLCVLSLPVIDMLLRGQVEALLLLGVALGYQAVQERRPYRLGFALLLLAIKPVNLALVFLLFLLAVRRWSLADWRKIATIPALVIALTTLAVGPSWPLDYLQGYAATPPNKYLNSTIWRAADLAGLPSIVPLALAIAIGALTVLVLWRARFGLPTLALAIAAMLLITPYANNNHYVLLIPALLAVPTRWRLLAWVLSFTPLLRTVGGYEWAVLDLGYVLALTWPLFRLHTTSWSHPTTPDTRHSLPRYRLLLQQTRRLL